MNRNEPVVIHEPLTESAVRYLAGVALPKNTKIEFCSESDDDTWDKYFQVGDMVEVRHNDDDKAQALAEYIAGCINLHRTIILALGRTTTNSLTATQEPTGLDRVLEDLQTSDVPSSRLDDMIHDAFGFDTPFALPYTSSMDAALALFRSVLPGYGYVVTHQGSTQGHHVQEYVGKVLCPPVNPNGAIDDRDSWATEYAGKACTEAMALVIATISAKAPSS